VAFRNLSDISSPTTTSAANPAFVYHYLSQNKPIICVTDDAHTQLNAWFAPFSLLRVSTQPIVIMAYNPVMQGEQMQYQDPRAYPQNYEMRSLAPSYTSTKGSFFSHSTPVHTDATGIHQRDHSGKWTPGFWKQFPVLAILSILGILASM
jgi:hypothetical protein